MRSEISKNQMKKILLRFFYDNHTQDKKMSWVLTDMCEEYIINPEHKNALI